MLYSLIYTIAFALFFAGILFRPKYRKKYFSTFNERCGFGLRRLNPEARPSIWLHAVSVGEVLALKTLVRRIKESFPGYLVLVSTTTITGQHTAREQLEADHYFYAPYDWKWSVRKVISSINPAACLIAETELWPNLIKALSEAGVPLLMVNGRISDRSLKGYKRVRWFLKHLLQRFLLILCQDAEDASRYHELGAREHDLRISGNLKFDQEHFQVEESKVLSLKDRLCIKPEQKVFLAASIHKGEHDAVLAAWRSAREQAPNARMILVPRKPMEFEFFSELLTREQIAFQQFSSSASRLDAPVVLVDTIGQLSALYHLATIAFVGGSLVNTGGHNLLEACAAEVPCLFGPYMHNFRAVHNTVLEHDAGIEVSSAEELADVLCQLLGDDDRRGQFQEGARSVIRHAGTAVEQTLRAVDNALSFSGSVLHVSWYFKVAASLHKLLVRILTGDPAKQLAKAKKLPKPVISVGGISFGGAGKTPLTAMIAEEFLSRGRKVTILTRGYGGRSRNPLLVAQDGTLLAGRDEAGDEAVMLAKMLPDAAIVKDPDRHRGGQFALQKTDAGIFLLEDGFQHRGLHRDSNILSINADSLAGPRAPSQLLREPLNHAKVATAIIIQKSTQERTAHALQTISRHFPDTPAFTSEFIINRFTSGSGDSIAGSELAATPLISVCGIASPSRFISRLREMKLDIRMSHTFADHHDFSESDIRKVLISLKKHGASAIITTAKDRERWLPAARAAGLETEAPLIVAEGRMLLDRPQEFFASLENAIK